MQYITKGINRINWILGAISAMVGFALVGIVVYGVITRYIFKQPTAYSYELPEVFFIAAIALSLAYTQIEGRHVRIDIITSRFPKKLLEAVNIFVSLATVSYCVIVAWALWQRTITNFDKGMGMIETHTPLAPFSLLIVVGMVFFALQVIIESTGLIRKKETPRTS